MLGTNSQTGKPLSGFEHFKQSIQDILATRKGSRVMRRDYGSNLPELVDAPANPTTVAQVIYEGAIALTLWEPRLALKRIVCESITAGKIVLGVEGTYLPDGQSITMDGITVS
jgi:uncharacterized protein